MRSREDREQSLALAGLLVLFALSCSSGQPPATLWEELAVAAGTRPAGPTTHSLWLFLSSVLVRGLPAGWGFGLLRLMGPFSLGLLAYFFDDLLQMLLPAFLRRQLVERRSHVLIRAFVILPVTALFAMSEPVWRLAHFFTPDLLNALLGFFGIYGLVRFRRTYRRAPIIVGYIAMGLLCIGEPLGFLELIAVTVIMTRDAFALKSSGKMLSTVYVALYIFLQRLLLLLSVGAFVIGTLLAGRFFFVNDGLAAVGGNGGEAIIDFVRIYLLSFVNAATPGGWLYFLGFGPLLLFASVLLLPRVLDIEKILHYRHALCYIGAGLAAFLLLANFPVFWIWQRNHGPDLIGSPFLLALLAGCAAGTLASALLVLLVEVFFRHYDRFAGSLFHDAPNGFVKGLDTNRRRWVVQITWIAANSVPFVLVLLSLVGCPKLGERGMYAAVRDFVRLAADDCAGADAAITDGSADAALEFEMDRRGVQGFKTLSMLSESTSRDTYLRRRGEKEGTEDWIALGISTPGALRDWVRTSSPRAAKLAVQLGFEIWRQEKTSLPPMGATAARTDGFAPETRSNLVTRAYALGERMLALADDGAPFLTSDTRLRELWNFALWRLARTARLRADEADAAGDLETARRETAFADRLDDRNPSYQAVRRRLEWVPRQVHNRFTPREGLHFALRQADFTLASTYARQILAKNEHDFHGNFAMGMYYAVGEQYTRALMHLERAHAAKPEDSTVLNNLATVELHLGRLDKARAHAEAALALAPDIPEIRRTIESVNRAAEKASAH